MRNLFVLLMLSLSGSLFAGPPKPVRFVENLNQWDCNIHFAARIPGGNMSLHTGGFSYAFMDEAHLEERHHLSHQWRGMNEEYSEAMINTHVVNVKFQGANPNAVPFGMDRSTEYYNFFVGARDRWAGGAYGYGKIVYPSFYSGIDLHVYSVDEHVKYDFIVAPMADPSTIKFAYEGASRVYLDNGNLYAETTLGNIIERRPHAWQIINGVKHDVICEFRLTGGQVEFVFPESYDPCHELVIDPLLIFSTFSGSLADNWGSTATPGERGNLYSAGVTNHFVVIGNQARFNGPFPATTGAFQTSYGGAYDIGILKYDSIGKSLLYASYLGGTNSESPHSLVVNSQRELIVLGTTSSSNFPASTNAFDQSFNGGAPIAHVISYVNGSDITLTRISADGKTLLASTYLGGSGNDGLNDNTINRNYGDHLRGDVITDAAGNIYVSTVTGSLDFGGVDNTYHGGETDAILLKIPPSMNQITWSRYLGGSGTDAAHTLKLDAGNNIYTAGGTTSTDFAMTAGAFQIALAGDIDGWIARLDNDGTILGSTYTGTSSYDQVYFLDLNKQGEVYVYGQTSGSRAITPGVYSDANSGQFIQKFASDLSEEKLYTVFGTGRGIPDISPTAFMVSDCNYLYMAGWGGNLNTALPNGWPTTTTGLPTTEDALQRTTAGHDFYFIVLSEDAKERLYATFLGGTISRTHVDGGTSRFDKSGIVYHSVCAGCRSGTANNQPASDFPTTSGVWSRQNKSLNCNNAAFKFDLSSLRAKLILKGSEKVCLPGKIELENQSIGGEFFIWDFGDGSAPLVKTDKTPVTYEFDKPGAYTVWLKTIDQGTCKVRDSTSVRIQVFDTFSQFPEDAAICEGSSKQLTASGGAEYHWVSVDGKFNQKGPDGTVTVSPRDSTMYYITITEPSGCTRVDSVYVHVIPDMHPEFDFERSADCGEGIPLLNVASTTDSLWVGDLLEFDFGDGTTSDLEEVQHQFEEAGEYVVKLRGVREFCVFEKEVPMAYGPLKYPNVISPDIRDGKNDVFRIQFGDDPSKTPLDYGFKTELVIYDRRGKEVFRSDDYQHNWSGAELSGGVYYYQATVQEHATCKGWIQLLR